MKRRDFITTALAACASVAIAVPALGAEPKKRSVTLPVGTKILFQGDSITDTSRDRERQEMVNDPAMLGLGYVRFASSRILCDMADRDIKILNRGISGNRVGSLMERWQKDCIDLKPDILSILIGVNDFWHTLSGKFKGTPEEYIEGYRELISLTKKKLPNTRIIIGEPFTIAGGTAIDPVKWSEFAKYQEAARVIAKEFGLTFIPYQQIFDDAAKKGDNMVWGVDGVHPSMAGMQLMADKWCEYVL